VKYLTKKFEKNLKIGVDKSGFIVYTISEDKERKYEKCTKSI
jgi:hypothetical protein